MLFGLPESRRPVTTKYLQKSLDPKCEPDYCRSMEVALTENKLSLTGSPKTSYMGRILDILEMAAVSPDGPMTLTEIASQAHVPLSTTSRLLAQLEEWGFLIGNDAGRYVPGGRLVRMSVSVASQLHSPQHLLEATKALAEATGESVTGGLIVGTKMFIVARTESEHPLRAVNRIGELISPVHAALGKAVMSRLSERKATRDAHGCRLCRPRA